MSGISCSDFPTDGRKDEFSSILPASFEQQTPHNHTRTMQSISDEIFSPGSFFASRSGQLGDLGSKDQTSRPTWYTPKHDAQGRLIDPIGITPNHRPEKSAATDTNVRTPLITFNVKKKVRHPLYVPTPSANRKIGPLYSDSAASKLEKVSDIPDNEEGIEKNSETGNDMNAHLEEAADTFDWQNALEVTIPDTTVAEEQSANITMSSCSSLHSTNRQKQHMKISFSSSPSSINCCFSPSAQKASQSMILELTNDGSKPICWSFNLVGSCSLSKNNITDIVSDPIFRSECAKGKLDVRESKFFKVRFMPVQKGLYRALFHLKTSSRVITVWFEGSSGVYEKCVTNIPKPDSKLRLEELIDFDLGRSSSDRAKSNDAIAPFTPMAKTTKTGAEGSKTPAPSKNMTPSEYVTPKAQSISLKSPPASTGTKLHTPKLIRHKLDFGAVRVGETRTLYLRVSNPNEKMAKVSFAVTGEFAIPLKELKMSPRSYFVLPICFQPSCPSLSSIDERLIVKRENQTTIRLGLIGSVV